MNIAALVRNAEIVNNNLSEVGDKLFTLKGCKIQIPKSYEERSLAILGEETYIMGIYAMIVDDKYFGVSSALTMLRITPTSIRVIDINDEDYYEFWFEAGSVVIDELNAIKEDTLPYYVYNEIVSTGRVPWFIDDNDYCCLMDSAPHHAGVTVGNNHMAFEIIASKTNRNPNNLMEEWRYSVSSPSEAKSKPPRYIPFKSTTYTATNNVARLAGSRFKDNVTVALLTKVEIEEPIEQHLRKSIS